MDGQGGMWIRLTVCGVTRLGYGHAGDKTGGDAIKEVIGDALRNAAMRFGAALDLWHKGDLHGPDADDETASKPKPSPQQKPATSPEAEIRAGISRGDASGAASYLAGLDAKDLDAIWSKLTEAEQESLTAAWPKD
jgi:hypothetical protein